MRSDSTLPRKEVVLLAWDWLVAGATTALSLILAVPLLSTYRAHHRPYALWWGLSFFAVACAAGLQSLAFLEGTWPPIAYRIYAIAAAAVPGVMGAGSLYLLWPKLAKPFAAVIGVAVLLAAWGALSSVPQAELLSQPVAASAQVTAALRAAPLAIGFAISGSLGGAALVLGALWSWWRSRLGYNLGIAAGGILFSLGNSLAALGVPAFFFVVEGLGIIALYLAVRSARLHHAPATVSSPNSSLADA